MAADKVARDWGLFQLTRKEYRLSDVKFFCCEAIPRQVKHCNHKNRAVFILHIKKTKCMSKKCVLKACAVMYAWKNWVNTCSITSHRSLLWVGYN